MSFDFDASSRYGDASFTTQYDMEDMTLAAWVKCTAAQWADTTGRNLIIFGNDPTTTLNSSIRTRKYTVADAFRGTTTDSGGSSSSTASAIPGDPPNEIDDVWVPIFGVFSSSTLRRVIVRNTSTAAANSTLSRTAGTAGDAMRICAAASGFSNFNGLVGHVAVWNTALSDAQCNTIWTATDTGNSFADLAPSNLIAYYPMDYDNVTQTNEGTDATGDITLTNKSYSTDNPVITSTSTIAPIAVNHIKQLQSN